MASHHSFFRSLLSVAALSAGFLLLGGCGGGGGDGAGNGNGNGTPPTATESQTAAATSISKAINANGAMLTSLAANSSAVGELLELAGVNTGNGGGVTVQTHDGGNDEDIFDNSEDLFDNIESLVTASLGLAGTPSISIVGDVITIDPDDNRVCMEELLGMNATADDLQQCEQVVSHLTVAIIMTSDSAGSVRFLYDDLTILLVAFSSNSASFEIFLGDLATILGNVQAITDPDEPLDLPDTLSGALELSAEVTNDTMGQEAGSLSLAVTQPINIVDTEDEISIVLGNSVLFSLSGDAGAGTATVSAALGSVDATFPVEDFMDEPHNGALAIGGLSVAATLGNEGNELVVTNFGITPPFTFTVDDAQALALGLAIMGFTVDGAANTITLDAALDFDVSATNVAGILEDLFDDPFQTDLMATLAVDAPAQTVFTVLDDVDETLQLTTGGPLTATGTGAVEGSVVVNAGQCVDEDEESDFPFVIVACPQ